ncbi:FlgD immunoglobulin-like domain containing protein [Microbulbifer litoralis]|uniref:FlgD immunoglobulin-like domain containing protein n=1 Tax=Microbulbifer litoralis TaxID=2933965 RepID=UPI0020295F87|nr:FlgD immunoglobulin-like domain containing protein [Microbulbifer sp. GX H0434]
MSRAVWLLILALISNLTQALEITQVRLDKKGFNPADREKASIHFNIDKPAQVVLHIYDGRERLVNRINGGQLPSGDHKLAWNGRDSKGKVVPPEAYSYTLTATSERKDGEGEEKVTHDLTDLTGGEALAVKDVRWDKEQGVVRYHLDKPARVSIRLGLKEGGPLLRTLVDWVPRDGGAQAEPWGGWDSSHALNIGKHPKLNLAVTAYSLSDNTLLVGPKPTKIAFADLPADKIRKKTALQKPTKRMYYHADQPLESRGDFETYLTLGTKAKKDKEGRWIVSGKVPIRLDVAEKDRERLLARRFEPVFFVDGTFAFENEVGFLPMTWQWDSSTVNEGEHYVTVNVRGYEGNFGTATMRLWVEHQ